MRQFLRKWAQDIEPLYLMASTPDDFSYPSTPERNELIDEVIFNLFIFYNLENYDKIQYYFELFLFNSFISTLFSTHFYSRSKKKRKREIKDEIKWGEDIS